MTCLVFFLKTDNFRNKVDYNSIFDKDNIFAKKMAR